MSLFNHYLLVKGRAGLVAGLILLLFSTASAALPEMEEKGAAREIHALFAAGRYNGATERLKEFGLQFPASPELPSLRLTQARSNRNFFFALELYRRFNEDYPKSPLAPAALAETARLYMLGGDTTSAAREARRLLDAYPTSSECARAHLLLGRLHLASGRFLSAEGSFKTILAIHSQEPGSQEAELSLAETFFRRGALKKATTLYRRILKDPGPELDLSLILFRLGEIAEREKRRLPAARNYRIILTRFPVSFHARAAKERLETLQGEAEKP